MIVCVDFDGVVCICYACSSLLSDDRPIKVKQPWTYLIINCNVVESKINIRYQSLHLYKRTIAIINC